MIYYKKNIIMTILMVILLISLDECTNSSLIHGDVFSDYGVVQRTLTKDYRSISTGIYSNEMQDEVTKDLFLARRNRGLKI